MSKATPAEPSSAGAPYVIGYGRERKHAVARAEAVIMPPQRGDLLVFSLCGAPAVPVPCWGAFERANPLFAGHRAAERCPHCVWRLAIEQHAEAAEIAMLTPVGRDLEVLARLLPDPMIVPRICEAILDQSARDYDWDHPQVAQMLGHVTAHAPQVLAPEECWEGGCDHEREGGAVFCARPDAAAGCAACSVLAGPWAGEWEGQFDLPVTAPCDVLRAFARRYGVPIGGPVAAATVTAPPSASGERA